MKTVLSIAGSDCSGGAGIQADIKTITAHKLYAMSVITALTAQNTTGVYGIHDIPSEFVANQLDCVFSDIHPDSVKIGMVSNVEIINIIAEKLIKYNAQNIILDPVMVSTSGSKLISDNAIEALTTKLFPLAAVITPNIPEAEALTGCTIKSRDCMVQVAEQIAEKLKTGAVLIKGGHFENRADDLLYLNGTSYWFEAEQIDTNNNHGTGCTLSSAIACNLAAGYTIEESVLNSKDYITGALKIGLNLGKGCGPLNHCYRL